MKELKIDYPKFLDNGEDAIIDVSGLFDQEQKVRVPMDTLCEKFLGLKHQKKKNMPHAFQEAKVHMALFYRYQEIYQGEQPMMPKVPQEEEPEVMDFTGQELENFI